MGILGCCFQSPMRERIGVPVLFLLLLGAVVLGLDMIAHPRRHMNAFSRSGGEMLRELRETEMQILGLLVIGGACWALYRLVTDVWSNCFG